MVRAPHRVSPLVCLLFAATAGAASFVNFESGHVRPLALSPDGTRLFAVDTPDNRLEIYGVGAGTLTLQGEVPVGLEPVAVAARSNTEVWVVNHLSDSVSIVQVNTTTPALSHVIRTLHTCDEPRDIVFAGSGNTRAFVTTARRGQNCPVAANLTAASTPRALVQVWNATNLGAALGGTPLTTIALMGDTPRALARTPDGSRVYAAVFHSGNRTTAIGQTTVNGNLPPDPSESQYPTPKPPVGLIVKFDPLSSTWKDERSTSNWNAAVPFTLPDRDVFVIDANANPPAPIGGTSSVIGVGTVLFNMAVRPNGKLYVANLESRNQVRFEPRIPSTGGGVQGHITESRITVVDPATLVPTPRHLNPQIDYACVPPGCANDQTEIEQSLAFPMDLQFSSDGARLYVVGFGSEKIGIFDAAQLEAGTINATTKHLVDVGGGPSGLALDEAHNQLFVMNRFDDTISIVQNASSPTTASELTTVPLRYDPSPSAARVGRRFLYDARHTSAHGDNACASCHIFGDFDSLAWDLSNPLDPNDPPNDNPFRLTPNAQFSTGGDGVGIPCTTCDFHPMKGPMTTQTLRGMAPAGPMHWRGDRTGSTTGGDALDETLAFKAFNPAFVGLLGHDTQLSPSDMQAYADFILTVTLPPNPIRDFTDALANLTFSESQGSTFFNGTPVDGGAIICEQCHRNPLGTDGLSSFEGETQEFKIPHLRNLYQKVGMFASAGEQVRGFGFLHDGSVDTVFDFLHAGVFTFGTNPDTKRRNVEAFLFAFDTGLAPAVGQQVTVTPATVNDTGVINRIDLLIARDDAGRCDLVAKGIVNGEARGAVYVGGNNFQTDRNTDALLSKTALRNLAATAGQEQTYTCVPVGSGVRIGVDRDQDGTFDRRELDCGTDPADPASVSPPSGTCGGSTTSSTTGPSSTTTSTSVVGGTTTSTLPFVLVQSTGLSLRDHSAPPANPDRRRVTFRSNTRNDPPVNMVQVPARGSAGDPTVGGATVQVYNSNGSGEKVTTALPASGWTAMGTTPIPRGYKYRSAVPTDPIARVVVRDGQLRLRGGHAAWGYTLTAPSQGRVAVRVTLGTAAGWCADSPAKIGGNPPSSANYDHVDKFVGESHVPPPAACPVMP